MKYHYVYQIENLIDGKIYVGKHSTDDLNDGYMGSGTLISRAIAKHGLENFRKTILRELASEEEALLFEAQIVDEDFVKRDDTYNLVMGGSQPSAVKGTPSYDKIYSSDNQRQKQRLGQEAIRRLKDSDPDWTQRLKDNLSEAQRRTWREGKRKPTFTGKTHSDETRRRISESHRLSKHSVGRNNSQYGTMWIYNDTLRQSIKIKIEQFSEYAENGWVRGRKLWREKPAGTGARLESGAA